VNVLDETAVPAAARLVRDFVNTYEPQVDKESLTSPGAVATWFAERGLLRPDARLRRADLAVAVTLREGLRAVLLGNAGHPSDPAAVRRLDAALAAVPVRLSLSSGAPRLVPPPGRPFDEALAGLLEAIRRCAEDQQWARLKVCDRDTCRWAYYDSSRNQARRWCSMAGCGNYVKMRHAYATRRSRTTGASHQPPAPE
jgi:predicted RNA-binding Zn ribbon-like protein